MSKSATADLDAVALRGRPPQGDGERWTTTRARWL